MGVANNRHITKRIERKKRLLDQYRPLPQAALKKLKEVLSVEWTYNSNAIEGNTLTLRETQLVLEQGMTIKGKALREHFEVKNHEKAIHLVEGLAKRNYELTEKDILEVQDLVLQNIEDDYAGRYRSGQVRILGANFIPPNPVKVPYFMGELVEWVNSNPEKLDIVTFVARFHHQFVWIHPFFDGNGRTARLITNLWLMKLGYPPAIILKNDRLKYYDALNKANDGDFSKMILITGQSIERSLDMYLQACVPSDEEYMPLAQLAENHHYSQAYLSLLARRGELDSYKLGRNWVSSEKALQEYLESRERKWEFS